TTFFAVGLIAVALAVAPMGRAALPALGFRAVGWRPVVLGTLGTVAVSVAVSQLGLEPQGVKEAMAIAREPALFAASLVALAGRSLGIGHRLDREFARLCRRPYRAGACHPGSAARPVVRLAALAHRRAVAIAGGAYGEQRPRRHRRGVYRRLIRLPACGRRSR